jgi:hypothetical protein
MKRQYLFAEVLVGDKLMNINKATSWGLSEKPISFAMAQRDTKALRLLLAEWHWRRLHMPLDEAYELRDQARELEDGSIASLLQVYIERKSAAIHRSRRRGSE